MMASNLTRCSSIIYSFCVLPYTTNFCHTTGFTVHVQYNQSCCTQTEHRQQVKQYVEVLYLFHIFQWSSSNFPHQYLQLFSAHAHFPQALKTSRRAKSFQYASSHHLFFLQIFLYVKIPMRRWTRSCEFSGMKLMES